MRLLLDSQVVFLWLTTRSVPEATRRAITDSRSHVLVSSATIWELAIKQARGRLALSSADLDALLEADFELLPISPQHALDAARLPPHHRDPFDRMLIAQARAEHMTLVGGDRVFERYEVDVLWA